MWITRPGDAVFNLKEGLGLGRGPSLFRDIVEEYKEQYKDGVGAAFYRDPIHTTMDALTVIGGVSGVLKVAGKTARMAGTLASRSQRLLRVAEIAARTGDLLYKSGETVGRIPGAIGRLTAKPVVWAVNRSRVLELVKRSIGYTKLAREVRRMYTSALEERTGDVIRDMERLGLMGPRGTRLSPQELEDLVAVARGWKPETVLSERAKQSLQSLKEIIENRERELVEAGLLSEEQLLRGRYGPAIANALNIPLEQVQKMPMRELSEAIVRYKAIAQQEGRLLEPLYLPMYTEPTPEMRRINELNRLINERVGVRGAKFEPTLEPRTGAAEKAGFVYVTDPKRTLSTFLFQWRTMQRLSNLMDQLAAEFATHRIVKSGDKYVRLKIQKGQPVRDASGKPVIEGDGFRIDPVTEAFFSPDLLRRYYRDLSKAHEAAVKRFLRYSEISATGLDNATRLTIADLVNVKTLTEIAGLSDPRKYRIFVIPKDVASELAHLTAAPSSLGEKLSTLMDWWKFSVLTLRPVYYLANVIGDAILSVLAGTKPSAYLKAFDPRYKALIPKFQYYSQQAILENQLYAMLAPRNPILRAGDTLMSFASAVDTYFRRAMFISKAEAQVWRENMMRTGRKFFRSGEEVREALKLRMEKLEKLPEMNRRIAEIVEKRASADHAAAVEVRNLHRDLARTYRALKRGGHTEIELDDQALRDIVSDAMTTAEANITRDTQEAISNIRAALDARLGLGAHRALDELQGARRTRIEYEQRSRDVSALKQQLQSALRERTALSQAREVLRAIGKRPAVSGSRLQKLYGGFYYRIRPSPGDVAGSIAVLSDRIGEAIRILRELELTPGRSNTRVFDRLDRLMGDLRLEVERLASMPRGSAVEAAKVAKIGRSLAARVEKARAALTAFEVSMRSRSIHGRIRSLQKMLERSERELQALAGRLPTAQQIAEMEKRSGALDRALNILAERAHRAARTAEEARNFHRLTETELAHLTGSAEEARRIVEAINRATDEVNRFLVDYNALPPLERRIFRNLISFWGWFRQVNLLAAQLPFIRTRSTLIAHRLVEMAMDSADDERLPPWLRNSIPFATDASGNVYFINLSMLNPLGNTVWASGFSPADIRFSIHPIIKVAIETVTGRDIFKAQPLTPEEQIYGYNGVRWYIDRDGLTIRRAPTGGYLSNALSSISRMFPQVQMLDSLLYPYEKYPDSMPVVAPRPILDASGQPKYPYPGLYHLMEFLGFRPRREFKPDVKVIREKLSIMNTISREVHRESDPERRRYLLEAYRDLASGLIRVYGR